MLLAWVSANATQSQGAWWLRAPVVNVCASVVVPSADASARKTYYNLPFEQLHAPALGPAHPFSKDGMAAGLRNHRAGHVEDAHLSHFHFDDQYNTFMTWVIQMSLRTCSAHR